MNYLKKYLKVHFWLSDHPKVYKAIQHAPFAILALFGYLIDKNLIWDETAYTWIWILAAAWFVLWVTHRVLLRQSMKKRWNPEQIGAR